MQSLNVIGFHFPLVAHGVRQDKSHGEVLIVAERCPTAAIITDMRVLLVEDSVRLNEAIATGFRKSGYAVDVALDGPSGLWQAKSHDYDVIVLDIMLPGMDGMGVLSELRRSGRDSHVLILTARDTIEDRVSGLRAGADDYLIKPFAFDELLARVEALVRRRHGVKNPIYTIRGLHVNTASRIVERDGEVIELPARQYTLLEYFVLNPDTVLSRAQIESHLYDEMSEPMSNVVDTTVYALRKRIDRPNEPSFIQTRRGMGYVLHSDVDARVP